MSRDNQSSIEKGKIEFDKAEVDEIEFERYELRQPPRYHFDLERRDFFKVMGGGLVVLFLIRRHASGQESGRGRRGGEGSQSLPQDIGSWLHGGEDGIVTAFTGQVEVGHGCRTSLSPAAP